MISILNWRIISYLRSMWQWINLMGESISLLRPYIIRLMKESMGKGRYKILVIKNSLDLKSLCISLRIISIKLFVLKISYRLP